ncbi:hypothetical protein FHS51_003857 [Sphingobium wenxiniae]|nr:hypothetical protein [Sphingobium wenxiniae]
MTDDTYTFRVDREAHDKCLKRGVSGSIRE